MAMINLRHFIFNNALIQCPLQTVVRATPHIGLLHRGTEKLMEYKTYTQVSAHFEPIE